MHSSVKPLLSEQLQTSQATVGLLFNLALTVAMLAMGVMLFQPALDWAWQQITRPERQYHLLFSATILTLCAYRLAHEKRSLKFAAPNSYATLLVVAACVAYLLNQQYLQLNALSAALVLVFCFGLLGHFVSANAWRSCTLPLFLAMLMLPFEGYLDIFLGFPMRFLSAEVAANVLHMIGIASVNSDTVLLIDNRAAIVDIDCSGIRGFWIGSAFFCTMTWIERYRMDLRWLIIAALAAVILFMGNVVRIVALVLLDLVFDKGEWAQVLHESLGLLSFSFVIFFSWQLMRLYANRHTVTQIQPQAQSQAKHITRASASKVSITTLLLTCALVAFNFVQTDQTESSQPFAKRAWNIEFAEQRYTPQALNTIERKFFYDNGASAYKYSSTVEYAGSQHVASVLIVLSGHWKAQHKPEHCYVAQGYNVQSSSIHKIGSANEASGMSYRQLSLTKSSANTPYTSDYWFQSIDNTTVNYSRRVLSQLHTPDTPWVMVSVLWHNGVPTDARQKLLLDIQETISRNMKSHG